MPPSTSTSDRRAELDELARKSADVIVRAAERRSLILLVTHFDADGLSAGSITLAAVRRLGASLHQRVVESLSEDVVEDLAQIDSELIVLTDMGSGQLALLEKGFREKEVVVADHHQSLGEPAKNTHHFNPHTVGYDGSTVISGAGTAYLLAKAIDERNKDLSPMALVGCLGDQQDKGPQRKLRGLNADILRDAIELNLVEETQDLILFGRQTRPIHRAIASTTSPFLPGLSGEEDRCLALLDKAHVPTKIDEKWRTISDLSTDEKQRLVDGIIQHMMALKLSGEKALELIGSVYTLVKEDPWTPLRDGREFATLLNSCGRMGRASLGLALGLGERGAAFKEAELVYSEYKKSLATYMNWLTTSPGALVNMTGAVSSIVSSSNLFGPGKVTLVLTTRKDGAVKVSVRATDHLVSKGVNLGKILQTLTPQYGGNGGGHAIAAGATVDGNKLDGFLAAFEKTISSVIA
ncbi:MAG: hypothetical protein AUJ07_11810 [Crenarchaeota archaeon 13_1_40CM_3_53_5]|nr:MAG: hypothetical protein AUJ07_11810 [Crenarchaeota archaeon 13_1_40CM_3_53_5]